MSALSDFPAKENKAHGGGVQNYPQSHEPAPPSHCCVKFRSFLTLVLRKNTQQTLPKNYSSHPTQLKDWEKGKNKDRGHNTEKKVIVPQEILFRMIPGTWKSYISLLLNPPHCLCNGDHFCKAFDPWAALWGVFQHLDKTPSSSCGYRPIWANLRL